MIHQKRLLFLDRSLHRAFPQRRAMVTPPDVRSHGFERPLDAHQLSSWYFLALVVVSFFVLYTPVEVGAEGITVDCIYAILFCTTFYAGVMSMGIDPSDDGALKARKAAAAGLPDAEPPPPDATNHCGLCDAFVLKRSKHCRRCVMNAASHLLTLLYRLCCASPSC